MFLPFILIVSSITINIAICSDEQTDYSDTVDPKKPCWCPDVDDPKIPCSCTNPKRDYAEMDCECRNRQEACVCPNDLTVLMKRIRNYSDLQNKPMKTSMHKKSNTKMFLQKVSQRVKNDARPTPILYLLKVEE
ncbi:unnamed protein product, partial [Brenthis ino]